MARWGDKPPITADQLQNADRLPVMDVSEPVGDRDKTLTVQEMRKLLKGASYVGPLAPSVHNDASEGFGVGATWVKDNESPPAYYVLTDATVGAAVWKEINVGLLDVEAGTGVTIDKSNPKKPVINVAYTGSEILGVRWDKGSDPTCVRIKDAVGLVANIGVDGSFVQNDFDTAPVYRNIYPTVDEFGNHVVEIGKFYYRVSSGPDWWQLEVSEKWHAGFQRWNAFTDFSTGLELDRFLIGRYNGVIEGGALVSKPGLAPTAATNIVDFRTAARETPGGQIMDVEAMFMMQMLFVIEFATLNSQSVMEGAVGMSYDDSRVILSAAQGTNTVEVEGADVHFDVGQLIGIGASRGNSSVFRGRKIIDLTGDFITFDGNPVDVDGGEVVWSFGWPTGALDVVQAASGSLGNTGARMPMKYRWVENLWGNIYEWVDGINITDGEAWIARDASKYVSNVAAGPDYEPLGYALSPNDAQYITELGFDPLLAFAALPVGTGGSSSTYYADRWYITTTGWRVLLFGGFWNAGSHAGAFLMTGNTAASGTSVSIGARLLRKVA